MLLFRNAKTGEIVVGAEDRVEQCHYAAVVTRVEEELDNELTGGWKVVEVRSLTLSTSREHRSQKFLLDGTEVGPCIPVDWPRRKVAQCIETHIWTRSILLYHHPTHLLSVSYISQRLIVIVVMS